MSIIQLPMGIDMHVHFREPGNDKKETVQTGYRAAISGGIGTVLDMPNTNPPIDNLSNFISKAQKLRKFPYIHQIAAITDENVENGQLRELALKTKFFKVFMANSTGNLGINSQNMIEAFHQLSEYGSHIFIHAEDPEFINKREIGVDENISRPEKAEIKAIQNIIEIHDEFPELNFQITHVTTSKGAEKILEASSNNLIWDCLPKHLKFTSELVKNKGNYAMMNPPLRGKKTVEELNQLFQEGKIPILTSDHAPHTLDDKKHLVAGAPGVQELYLYLIDEFLNDNISKNNLIDMIYKNPKNILKRYNYAVNEGEITIDTDQILHFTRKEIKSKCNWSLWENYSFKGKIISFS